MRKRHVLLLLLVATIISLFFDKQILNFFIQFRYEPLNSFFVFASYKIVPVLLLLIISFVYFWKKWYKLAILWSGVALSFTLTTFLKWIIMRPRPEVLSLVDTYTYSFPSRHAAVVFAFLPLLFNKKKGLWVFFAALIIAYSRIYLGVHYLSDVLSGILLGLLCGYGVILLDRRYSIFLSLKGKKQ